jgi:hypothetical protein
LVKVGVFRGGRASPTGKRKSGSATWLVGDRRASTKVLAALLGRMIKYSRVTPEYLGRKQRESGAFSQMTA